MKKILIHTLLIASIISFSGCLKDDLPETKSSGQKEITGFDFEHRWTYTEEVKKNGVVVETRQLTAVAKLNNVIKVTKRDDGKDTVYCKLSIPTTVPIDELNNVKISKIWAYAAISDAAIITPLSGSPILGIPGDFTKPVSYKVTAADGSSKDYTVVTKLQ